MSKIVLLTGRVFIGILLATLFPVSLADANDYWLIYLQDASGNIQYIEHTWFEDSNQDDLLQKKQAILNMYVASGQDVIRKSPAPRNPKLMVPGKPVITKKDDAHALLLYIGSKTFICTKTYEAFKQESPTAVYQLLGQSAVVSGFTCDLDSRDKGNTRITYSISEISAGVGANAAPIKTDKLKEEVRVRELYRFRITAGPVWSSLTRHNKSFKTITNVNQSFVIASSRNNDAPVNFPIFLKMYWKERDILAKLPALNDVNTFSDLGNFLLYRVNPIVGINLVDNPLKNYYMGLSFEIFSGLDVVGGAHLGKVSQLAGGFRDEQIVPTNANPPTVDKFLTGGFVGVTADVGVIASWIGNSIMTTVKGIK